MRTASAIAPEPRFGPPPPAPPPAPIVTRSFAVARGARRERREGGAGAGLAEGGAPAVLAGEERPQESLLGALAAVRNDRRRGGVGAEEAAGAPPGGACGASPPFDVSLE